MQQAPLYATGLPTPCTGLPVAKMISKKLTVTVFRDKRIPTTILCSPGRHNRLNEVVGHGIVVNLS